MSDAPDIITLQARLEAAEAEVARLRAIFPEVLRRLRSGACAPDCSPEFLEQIPNEVGAVTDALRARVAELERNGAPSTHPDTAWINTKTMPEIKKGTMKKFLITYETRDGKRGVKCAWYANEHWIEWSDDASPDDDDVDDDGGKRWTGWMEDRSTYHGDDYIMAVEETVVAWMPMPAAASATGGAK